MAEALTIQLEKDFKVPVERLFEAWTREEDLKQWWHPMGNNLRHCTNELQEGGKVAYDFETADGDDAFVINGNYKAVKAKEELIYTWNWVLPTDAVQDSSFVLSIRFLPSSGGSKLSVKQENFQSEESVQPHREGWEKSLADLERHLS
ncbi:MAG TPA: SRPBCC family protein [Flavisolibacter sp.]|nr:SRPBCC family protein [Flavisolibacter sp.]